MKKLKFKDIRIGMLVVCNDTPEAIVFTVAEIDDHFSVRLSYKDPDKGQMWVDYTLCHKPNATQLELYHDL